MCPHCADGSAHALGARHHVLHLLALVEHPAALPVHDALRIARSLLAWAEADEPSVVATPVATAAGGAG
jgi:hypothetical protein